MEIIIKKLEEIKPYVGNPRVNSEAVSKVAESIKLFGMKQPIVIDSAGVIIAGHTRYEALKSLKSKTAPCIVAKDLTKDQAKAYRLVDNKAGELATWNTHLLAIEIEDIEIDLTFFGFDDTCDGAPPSIEKSELRPYRKVHYLVSFDINHNDSFLEILDKVREIEGVEIESTLN